MKEKKVRKTKVFVVPAGVNARVIKSGSGEGDQATVHNFTTSRRSAFVASEVVVHPQGSMGRWGPNSQTVGGELARSGMMGFSRQGLEMVLLVPAEHVLEEEV